MQDASETGSTPTAAGIEIAAGLLGWLGDLLGLARDRGDAALARLVADLMDGLGGAATGR